MSDSNMNYAGLIVISAIAILIGTSLFSSIGNDVGTLTKTNTLTNYQFTIGANGTTTDLIGQTLLSVPTVVNATGMPINTVNYTIREGISTATGFKTIQYKVMTPEFASGKVNITYNYGNQGYIESSGGRAMIPLIFVFFALLIMIIALTPALRSGIMDFYDRVRGR